ncbi:hypothetical protein BDW71DRAFT_190275 [Aspergillus fruticulosus]
MSTLKVSAQLLSNGTKIAQAALTEVTKTAVTYGKPVIESSTGLAAQAAEWASKNPALAVSTAAGLAVIAVPGLVVAPTLSAVGFGTGGVQACSCPIYEFVLSLFT